jgi:hypothetical protein
MVKLAYVIQRLWSHRVIKQMVQRWNDWMQVIYSVSYDRYSRKIVEDVWLQYFDNCMAYKV